MEAGKEVGLINRIERLFQKFMNRQLQTALMHLEQAAYFQEIVAIEGVHHFRGVVPHTGVNFACAVAQTLATDMAHRFSFAARPCAGPAKSQ